MCILGGITSGVIAIALPQYRQVHWAFDPRYISTFNASELADCFNWPIHHQEKLTIVDCSKPHYFEITALLTHKDLAGSSWESIFSSTAEYPEKRLIAQLKEKVCAAKTAQYLGHPFDRNGVYTIELMYSNRMRWKHGDRVFRCGVVENSEQNTPIHFSGEIKNADPSPIWPTGICLKEVFHAYRAIPCIQKHHLEVIGVAKLSGLSGKRHAPSIKSQNHIFDILCVNQAKRYLGDPDKLRLTTLTPLWDTLTEQGWVDGERTVNCYLGSPIHIVTLSTDDHLAKNKLNSPRFKVILGSAKKNITIDGDPPHPLQKPPLGERIDPPVPLPEGLESNPMAVPAG